ncbi:Phenylalanine dehydrogenase [Porphyridium purpureum]|uniref:Phenylalanine dehydrogenase n=1 Tax=Porphyridium purpureum TaxID=35688 RepID=A0A5J4Z2E9_PORPP|nr:Phenylalanine dehydrogenase [Porphyridium purpureum]|eukprot:POR9660..scf295_1
MVQSACVVDAAAGDNEKDGTRSDDPALKTVPTYAIDTSRSPLERVDLKAYGLGADGAGVDVYKVALAAKLGDLYIGLDSACCDAVPGNGGLRVRQYRKPRDAVMDVVQLTRTMSMKHNMFNTGFAGAKLVVAAADAPECLDKRALMREVARSLALMRGRVYTGCDLNTSSDDMVYLDAISPYVLSGITNATLDTNVATAMGTFAAIVELAEHLQLADGFCVLVQGAGKVGATLASRLVAHGCRVRVTDLDPSRADIAGCENVSAAPTEWFRDAHMDVFAPCAASGVIDERVAQELAPQCRAIVGSANVPFRTPQAAELCAARGVVFVPESITSAGAIIIDSVEWCLDKCSFAALRPNIAYHFVQNQIAAKTREFCQRSV